MTSDTGRDFPDLRVIGGNLLPGVRFGLTTREAGATSGDFARGNLADHVGDSAVAVEVNRAQLARSLGAGRGLAVIAAVHGASTCLVRHAGTYSGVDALVTDQSGVGLVALGADCAVIGVAGTRSDGSLVVGVAHCGWRGLVTDVLASVVHRMESLNAHRLRAVVGPAICGQCYLVDESRIQQVRQACSTEVVAAAVGAPVAQGGFPLDIHAGVLQRLRELNVDASGEYGCTAEDDRWFSHRAAVSRGGPQARTGRHGLGIMIAAEPIAHRQGGRP